jgi:hypothetical protein
MSFANSQRYWWLSMVEYREGRWDYLVDEFSEINPWDCSVLYPQYKILFWHELNADEIELAQRAEEGNHESTI